jgi:hypothetical protein
MAAAGELHYDGQRLEPFETNEGTVRDLARNLRLRTIGGKRATPLENRPHRDAIETLRRRLITTADVLLRDLERQSAKAPGTVNLERLRQIARMVREAAALPGPDDPRPPAPGVQVGGFRNGGTTRGGLAGRILNDAAVARADR